MSEIPQKLDYVADVQEEHRTVLVAYLKRAYVDADTTVLVHQPDNSKANDNEAADKSKAGNDKAKV